jgi:hypothetical protein
MTAAKSSSLILATAGSENARTFKLLPVGVSAFPSAPWHAAHFCLYNPALLSSDLAGAINKFATISAVAVTVIPMIRIFAFVIESSSQDL